MSPSRWTGIRTVVISRLHFDRIGGVAEVPRADLLASKEEWRQVDFARSDEPLVETFADAGLETPGKMTGS